VRSANGVSYTYDLNGNVSMRGRQHLLYNAYNQLCKVWNTNGLVTTFGYAADGSRLWEQSGTNALQVWIGGSYEEKNGQTLYHVLANGQTVCTFDKTGTNVWQYYHPDYLGSTSLQTDQSGNEIQHYEYSAFGQSRYTGNTNAFKATKRFTGQSLDEDTGLYYYGDASGYGRYYIPELARWAQGDDRIPDLFNPQSYNRYSYVLNNPLRFTDPSGHEEDDFDVPLTLGAGHAALRQSAGGASAGLYNQSGGELKAVATGMKTAVALTPAGTAIGLQEAVTGQEAYSGEQLNWKQRTASGVLAATPAIIKIGGKAVKAGEVIATDVAKSVQWTSYGGRHVPPSNVPWKKIIESSTSGLAKYKPGIPIEKLERTVWETGIPVSNGKPWKVAEFTGEIGASGGKSSRWVRVEETAGAIHGHPITQQEFQKLTKKN
jgi:RHS repeat-associated protein